METRKPFAPLTAVGLAHLRPSYALAAPISQATGITIDPAFIHQVIIGEKLCTPTMRTHLENALNLPPSSIVELPDKPGLWVSLKAIRESLHLSRNNAAELCTKVARSRRPFSASEISEFEAGGRGAPQLLRLFEAAYRLPKDSLIFYSGPQVFV